MNEERSVNKDIIMTPHSLEVNGIHLHYVTWGQFSQPERAVLLVHGLTNNHLAAEGESTEKLTRTTIVNRDLHG